MIFNENFFINVSFVNLFVNCFISWILYNFKNQYSKILILLNCTASICLIIFFFERWFNSHHFPISNLYESLIFLSFCINLGIFWLYLVTKNLLLYCLSSPWPLLINAFGSFCLSSNLQKISPLIPALKSNWLLMHVTVMIISYSTLIIGSLLAICFVVVSFLFLQKKNVEQSQNIFYSLANFSISPKINDEEQNIFNLLDILDNLSYRFIGLSFPFLTIGIISGAVWANETWGSYWNWDPKETWALITWLVFAIYLHSRLISGKTGGSPALIASFGFIVVWVCYLGVNLLGKGLHSYGWFN
uniref:Cytochrome c biogenesis protein CcsA n=1 Tax=Pedinomonas tuberculata TaxID=160064 RepID=A0A097KL37_9CHLO|nr:heme attachment to plastid cytochrome c [Pedinomonas tuberculata]AIT93883.1 heme attachment to plastid cytochrome c [Pedinomonas tuberculata]